MDGIDLVLARQRAAEDAPPRLVCPPLMPKQAAVYANTEAQVQLFEGGAGCGKTELLILWVLDRMKRNPRDVATLVVAPTYPVLRQSTMLRWYQKLNELGIPHTPHDNACTVDGRLVIFRSAEHPDKTLPGADVGIAALDEGALCKHRAFIRIQQRVRNPKARLLQTLVVTTPEGTGSWVHQDLKDMPGLQHVRMSTLENHHLLPRTIETLRRTYRNNKAGWRQYVLGIATDVSGSVYSALSAENVQRLDPRDVEPNDQVVLGWDFNVHFMVTTVALWRERTDTLHFVGEVVAESHDAVRTVNHAADVRRYLLDRSFAVEHRGAMCSKGSLEPIRAFIDASGAYEKTSSFMTDRLAVINAGFDVRHPRGNPHVRDRVATVNANLAELKVLIDPSRAPVTLRALQSHNFDQWGRPQKKYNRGEFQADHPCDAVGYTVCGLLPFVRER